MNSDDLVKAIRHLKPSAEFTFQDADYSTIEWHLIDGDAPSFAEIETVHKSIKAAEIKAANDAEVARSALLEKLGITEEEAKLLLGGN